MVIIGPTSAKDRQFYLGGSALDRVSEDSLVWFRLSRLRSLSSTLSMIIVVPLYFISHLWMSLGAFLRIRRVPVIVIELPSPNPLGHGHSTS